MQPPAILVVGVDVQFVPNANGRESSQIVRSAGSIDRDALVQWHPELRQKVLIGITSRNPEVHDLIGLLGVTPEFALAAFVATPYSSTGIGCDDLTLILTP